MNNRYKFILKLGNVFFLLICLIYCFTNIYLKKNLVFNSKITAILVLILSINLLLKVRKNAQLVILVSFILYSNYSIVISRYLFAFKSNLYTQINDYQIYSTGVNILFLFMILINFFLLNKKINSTREFVSYCNQNGYIVLLIEIILIFILIFAFGRPDSIGDRGEPSALYEYSIIFFIIGFCYCGKNKKMKFSLLFIMILFIGQNMIYGGRITALQLLMVMYFFLIYKKIPNKIIIPIVFIIFIIMMAIGNFRGEILYSSNIIMETINSIKENKLTLDTAYSAYFTSMTFIYIKPFFDLSNRLILFFRFFLSMILGSGIPGSNLATVSREYVVHYYGGILPYFFYFWFGWIGILIPTFLLNLYFKMFNKENISKFSKFLSLYIVATVPRWYLYAPTQLIRGVLLFSLVYIVMNILNYLLKKNGVKGVKYAKINC